MESHEQNPPNGRSDRAAGGSDDASRTMGERLDHVSATAERTWDRTRDAFTDLKDALDIDGRVSRHPYGTVAAALGIGYVLGGGIFTPLTSRILGLGLRLGIRLAVLPYLTDEVLGIAEEIGGETETRGPRKRATKANENKGR
jgi:hypothetical protein